MRTGLLAPLIGALLTLTPTGAAVAGPVTFGQFISSRAGNNYVFDNRGDGSATFNSAGQVQFSFLDGAIDASHLLQALPVGPQLANLTRISATAGPAMCMAPCTAGSPFVQRLGASTVVIRRASDDALLLQIIGDFANLTGQIGGSAGNMETSSPPDQLTFTSDFVDFSGAFSLSRSISFTSATPAFAIAPDGLLRSFTAAGTGSFAADFESTAIYEPASLALLGMGLASIGLTRRRAGSTRPALTRGPAAPIA